MELEPIGIWSGQLRRADPAAIADAAAELDELGYGTIWIPGGRGGDVFGDVARLLDATARATVATGILNVWMHSPEETASGHASLMADHPGRFLLGLGVSHEPAVTDSGQVYARPLTKMREYLDALDATSPPVPAGERMLAALGPRMLELARDRSAGAHPYLVAPEHTALAREMLGEGPLIAPEVMVVLDDDADRARAVARQHLSRYLGLPNYTNSFKRHGFTDDDLLEGGSDRLVDGLIAWGDLDAIAARIAEHHAAGADHVCVQVLQADAAALPREGWRQLAGALL
ncbi:MAG: LLM class F420-dependent oxidoreductase [Ilumatobacteraceae bacterium]